MESNLFGSEAEAVQLSSPTIPDKGEARSRQARPSASRPVVMMPVLSVSTPRVPILAGASFSVQVTGKPNAVVCWQFGYQKEVLAQGLIRLNADGRGSIKLIAPKIRHRAACSFMLPSQQPVILSEVIVYPAKRLARASNLLKEVEVGVIDETSHILHALKDEGVAVKNLRPQLMRDSFSGGMVILGGFQTAEILAYECRKLQRRLESGMTVIIVNPPTGWEEFGITRVEMKQPCLHGVKLAKDLTSIVQTGDLGAGPWMSALHCEHACVVLGWTSINEKIKSTRGTELKRIRQPLIVTRSVGHGRVIVSMLPQMSRPDENAMGRALLSEIILWALKQRLSDQNVTENKK